MLIPSILLPDDKHEIRVNHFLPAQHNHLFNESDYFKLHSRSAGDRYAQLVRMSDAKVCATLAFHETEASVFSSPGRGTFGGLGLNQATAPQLLEVFFAAVHGELVRAGATRIAIVGAPLSHDPALSALMANIVMRHGYTCSVPELNCDMVVDARSLAERVDYSNVKRIRKCEREGFTVGPVALEWLPEIYWILLENRTRRGFPMTMSLEQLQMMAVMFPQRMQLFAAERPATGEGAGVGLAAAAVCFALTDRILYVLYWGDGPGLSAYSPVSLLVSAIYTFCQDRGFMLLDAGISTLHGEPNHGLTRFKQNLGFSLSLKMAFCWERDSA